MDKLREENKALVAALRRLVEAEVAWEQDRPGNGIELANARFNAEKLIGAADDLGADCDSCGHRSGG